MQDENEVRLRGHLGKDAEIAFNAQGLCFANLLLVANRKWRDAEGKDKEEATWLHVVVIGRQAEVIRDRQLKKGAHIEVKGYLRNRSWMKDGVKQYKTEIVAFPGHGFSHISTSHSQPDGYAED